MMAPKKQANENRLEPSQKQWMQSHFQLKKNWIIKSNKGKILGAWHRYQWEHEAALCMLKSVKWILSQTHGAQSMLWESI